MAHSTMTEKPPLSRYVIAVVVVWTVLLCATWLAKDRAHFNLVAAFCAGFLAGMLAMLIAVHLYRS
jgi:uncharacterized membrane protein YjdF